MKITILSNFFYPEKTGIGVTATDCALFLASLRHEVVVITTMPYYPNWEVPSEYRKHLFLSEIYKGLPIERVWLYVPKQPSTLKRIVHELSGSSLMILKGLFLKTNLILCISPPLTLGFLAAILAKLKRVPYWCYIKDIQPDAAINLGMLKNPLLRKLSQWMEKQMYKHSDRILVLSEGMSENIHAKSISKEKIAIVPDSIDTSELQSNVKNDIASSKFRRKYGLESKFLVLYSGNLGIKHNVEIIVECARKLRDDENLFFAIVGDGAAKKRVEKLISEYKLTNVGLFPLCERSDLGDMLASADVLLAPQRKEVVDIVVPSKLLAYLTSGSAVIASADGESESAKLLKQHQAGEVVDAENVDHLSAQIQKLQDSPSLRKKLGQNGIELIKSHFDHQVVIDKYYAPLFGEQSSQD